MEISFNGGLVVQTDVEYRNRSTDAVVCTDVEQAYHPQSWGNWGFEVDAWDAKTKTMRFGRGGNQEARGGGSLGARFFAGMLEELDSEFEFYHDTAAGKLYWAPPSSALLGSGVPPSEVVVPRLPRLIQVCLPLRTGNGIFLRKPHPILFSRGRFSCQDSGN